MYVGVILNLYRIDADGFRIPHVCGGDPQGRQKAVEGSRYSPCMWG